MRTSTSLGAAILMSALGVFAASAVSTSASVLARDGKIVFVRNPYGRIFIVNSDGTGAARLRVLSRVHRDTAWFQPSWSPDGKRLALIGYFDNGLSMEGDTRIYVRNPDGRAKVVMTLGGTNTSDVSWSPDGKRIVSDSGGDFPEIFIVRVATGKWHYVGVTYGANPSWSPGGAWICYQSYVDQEVKGLALVQPNGHGKVLLTRSGDHPDWSPDAKRIVFEDKGGIFVVDRDGSNLKRLTTRAGDSHPDWSPTGSRILFSRRAGSRTDLWVMRPDGSHQVRLIKNGEDPDWQPLR
jgi:TolB protein